MKKTIVHVYTGDGKGKTSAALGLALRAAGRDFKTLIIQFLKGRESGERLALQNIPQIEIQNYGFDSFIVKGQTKIEHKRKAKKALQRAVEALNEDWDILILDEINMALYYDLLNKDDVLKLMEDSRNKLELVITGRNAPKEVIEKADLVTEMVAIKHPYEEGFEAREGYEY